MLKNYLRTGNEPVFPMTLGRILKYYSDIVQWQFIQRSPKTYLLKVIVAGDKLAKEEEILSELHSYFGQDANIRIEYVDDIPVLNSGKRKPVVNEMKR